VNALSQWLELRIWRNNMEYFIRFINGVPEERLREVGPAPEGARGTEVMFMPSSEIFSNVEFSASMLEHRIRELAFLNSGVRIIFQDKRSDSKEPIEFHYQGGVREFARHLDKNKHLLHETIYIYDVEKKDGVQDDDASINVELALQWNDSYHENVLCFTNNIKQRDGGTHLAGFRAAVTRTINQYVQNNMIKKE
jgi:DNA gyrase subunit B